jgi:hypothetical protein
MRRWLILLPAFLLLMGPAMASEYYYESLSYAIEARPQGIAYACSLQFTSLKAGLSQVELTIPYAASQISSGPTVILDDREVRPEMVPEGNGTHLVLPCDEKRVGEMGSIGLSYLAGEGVTVGPGAKIPVRTLGLGANVTIHALSLNLPDGYTVSKVETPQGIIKESGSGGIPLEIGTRSVELVFVIRRTTPLDNPYVVWGIVLGSVAVVGGIVAYTLFWRKRRAGGGHPDE